MQKTLAAINKNYILSHSGADAQGRFESITLISPEDYAALDICFTSGQEVTEQLEALAEDIEESVEPSQRAALIRLRQYDGRFDVLHFEQISDLPDNKSKRRPTNCSTRARCWPCWASWPG